MLLPLRILASTCFFLLMLISWIIAFVLQLIVFLGTCLILTGNQRAYINGHIFRKLSALVVFLSSPFWRVRRIGKLPSIDRSVIVVCNHLSNADAFSLTLALFPWETKYVAKAGLFKIPFGGWCMSMAGDMAVYFDRKNGGVRKGTVAPLMDQAKKLLAEGHSLAVFPEGTRSPDGELGVFKDGMFGLAVQNDVPILPIAIEGSQHIWPKFGALLDSSDVYVSIGELIYPGKMTKEELRDAARGQVAALRQDLLARANEKKNKAVKSQ